MSSNARLKGLVSIIMPCFNAKSFIDNSIQSVIKQTYQNWELLIVDDASSDGSYSYIKTKYSFLGAKLICLRLENNSGAAVSRNKALEFSNGQYIAFLDCDDIWYEEKLYKQVSFMESVNCSFCFSAYDKIDLNGAFLSTVFVPSQINYKYLLKNCAIGCLTVIYDSSRLGVIYFPLIRKRQDYALWLNIIRKSKLAFGIKETLGAYRVRQGSISSNKFMAIRYTWQMYKEIEKIPFFYRSWVFCNYVFKSFLKNKSPLIYKWLCC